MQFFITSFKIFVILSLLLFNLPTQAEEKIYTVAVVPQIASIQIYRDWTPLLTKLEQVTGYRFKLLAYNEFSRFELALNQGVPDLVYLNPYHMVIAKQKNQYRPLVRDSSPLTGILVVRQDSPIKKLTDLDGKNIAFPSPNALGASLYMRALLAEKIKIKATPVYVGSHQNVYRHVLIGEVMAGGGVNSTLEKETEAVRSQLNILFTTPDISPHPLAAHPRVPVDVSKKIVAALLAMRNDPESSKLLAAVQIPQPIEADYKRDYAGLAQLKLERYAERQ